MMKRLPRATTDITKDGELAEALVGKQIVGVGGSSGRGAFQLMLDDGTVFLVSRTALKRKRARR